MSTHPQPCAVKELHISHVGLSALDENRLKAIMIAIVSNGEVEARWCMGDAATADLVVVAPDSEDARRFVGEPARNTHQVIAALVGESDSVSFECEKLQWPLRSASLLDLLKRVESRIPDAGGSASETPCAPADNDLVHLAKLLRDVESGDTLPWRVRGLSERSVYVAPHEKSFIFGDSLLNLLQCEPAALELVPITLEDLPQEGQRKPIRMLQWLVGLRSGRLGLLPWINADSTFRLKQFPEFQLLHHSSEHRRIAAALSRPRAGIKAIRDATELSSASVIAFINAASLCGYLKVSSSREAGAARKPSARPRRALFQVFRRALGIAQ
jgi:hypothetical protein